MQNLKFMKNASILICFFIITGCSSKSIKEDNSQKIIDQQILQAAEKIQRTQADLYQAGVINSSPKKLPPIITGTYNAITVNWQGDVIQLLHEIAQAENKSFSYQGVRVPIPISINVKDEPIAKVYYLLKGQVGYRAEIIQLPSEIILKYKAIAK